MVKRIDGYDCDLLHSEGNPGYIARSVIGDRRITPEDLIKLGKSGFSVTDVFGDLTYIHLVLRKI